LEIRGGKGWLSMKVGLGEELVFDELLDTKNISGAGA
jgi:hypothetical protein